jgi:hypothetical protein
MEIGDKMICKNDFLLEKGKTYYFDHEDLWDQSFVYVKDKDNFIYWAPYDHFMTLKEERKMKLKKIKRKYESRRLSDC